MLPISPNKMTDEQIRAYLTKQGIAAFQRLAGYIPPVNTCEGEKVTVSNLKSIMEADYIGVYANMCYQCSRNTNLFLDDYFDGYELNPYLFFNDCTDKYCPYCGCDTDFDDIPF